MEPVGVIEGNDSAVMRPDVDTDEIAPKQFLTRVERTGFGAFLAGIFYGDCTKLGLPPVIGPDAVASAGGLG